VTVEFWSRCLAQTRAGASLCSRSLPLQCRAEAARASRKLLDQPFGVLAALLEQPGSVVTRYVRRFRPRSKQGHQPHQRGPRGHGVCSTPCRNSSETRVSIHRVHRSFSHPGTPGSGGTPAPVTPVPTDTSSQFHRILRVREWTACIPVAQRLRSSAHLDGSNRKPNRAHHR
jgi:hypothetical protein